MIFVDMGKIKIYTSTTMGERKPTIKQKLFVEYYVNNNFNAAAAARAAGYSEKTARFIGCELLTKPNVKEELRKVVKRKLSEVDMLTLEWLHQVKSIATTDIRKAVTWNEGDVSLVSSESIDDVTALAISEVSQTVSRDGGSIKIKMHDKNKALDLLGKYLAILSDAPPQPIDPKSDIAMDAEKRRERIAELLRKMSGKE